MRWALLVTGASQGVGPEREGVTLAAGTGADIARMVRAAGGTAIAVDEHPTELEAVDGALSGAAVLEVPRVAAYVREHCDGVVPFKTTERLERVCRDLGLELLAAPARLARQLENKLELPGIARGAGVRFPATRTVRLDEALVDEGRRGELPLPAIYQPAVAFAGAGTRLVRDADELAALVASGSHNEVGKLCEVIRGGVPTCVTGVVLADGSVIAGAACRQLTGVADCTDMPFGSCGNDWTLDQASATSRAVRACAISTGAELARRGFAGTFGVDVVTDAAGEAVLVEVNPRVTASLGLQVQLQQLQGLPTLLDAHVAALAGDAPAVHGLHDCYGPDAVPAAPQQAASVILFHRGGDMTTPARLASGAWRLADGGPPARVRDAWRLEHLLGAAPPDGSSSPGEALLMARTHLRAVRPHAELARLVFAHGAAGSDDGRTLTPQVAAAVRCARQLVTDAVAAATT